MFLGNPHMFGTASPPDPGGGGGTPTATWVGIADTSSDSPATISGAAIGTGDAGDLLVIATVCEGLVEADWTSLTVGGNAATRRVHAGRDVGIWTCPAPAGSTADIVLTGAGGVSWSRIGSGIWRLTGFDAAPVSTGTGSSGSTGNSNLSTSAFSVASGDFVVAALGLSTDRSFDAWTGVANARGGGGIAGETGSGQHYADELRTSADAALVINADWTSGAASGIAAAAFRPS